MFPSGQENPLLFQCPSNDLKYSHTRAPALPNILTFRRLTYRNRPVILAPSQTALKLNFNRHDQISPGPGCRGCSIFFFMLTVQRESAAEGGA